ncbi:MAG: H-NS histone family protein [Dehalococcoidia bacterium]|nr:H-NS histone family protein [Dehalococcoidia bacterium]
MIDSIKEYIAAKRHGEELAAKAAAMRNDAIAMLRKQIDDTLAGAEFSIYDVYPELAPARVRRRLDRAAGAASNGHGDGRAARAARAARATLATRAADGKSGGGDGDAKAPKARKIVRNPGDPSQVWRGRGRKPGWLVELEGQRQDAAK